MSEAAAAPEDGPLPTPSWLVWALLALCALPFHPLWIDFEQVRRGMLLALVGAVLVATLVLGRFRLPRARGDRLGIVFVLALLASAVVRFAADRLLHEPGTPYSFQPWDAAYRLLHWTALLVAVRLGAATPAQRLVLPVGTLLLATSAFGLLQRLGIVDIRGYGVEREPVSTFGNLNVASEWTAVAAAAAAALLPAASEGVRRHVLHAALVLAGAYLVANQSRSGLVALPLALLVLALVRRERRALLPLALAGTGALLGLGFTATTPLPTPATPAALRLERERGTATLAVRLEIAKGATRLFAESPVYGLGPGQFAVHYPRVRSAAEIEASSFGRRFATEVRTAHDDWLELCVEGGLPALVLFAMFLFALQRGVRDKARFVPLLAMMLLMLVRSPVGNAPAAMLAFWMAGTPDESATAPTRRSLWRWLGAALGIAMSALGAAVVVAHQAFVPYVAAKRDGDLPPLDAARAASAWMPSEPRWLEVEAQESLIAGNLRTAERLAARACALRPFSPQLRLLLAEILAKGGDHGQALEMTRESLRLDPANPELRVLESVAYAELGAADRAIEAVVVDPHPLLRAQLGRHFADLALRADQRRDEKAAARFLAEHHFLAAVDALGSDEVAAHEVVALQWNELGKRLKQCGRFEQDGRWCAVGALHALDVGKPELASELGDAAAKRSARLLPWQAALLGAQLDRLRGVAQWQRLLPAR